MPRPIRVCFPFVGDTVGGSHISALELIKGLPQDVVEPLVVLHRDGPLVQMLRERDVTFEIAPNVHLIQAGSIASQLALMAAAAPRLSGFLRSRKIAIVHTNDARMHLTWGPAARLAGTCFIWHQRSADPSRRLSLYARLASEVLTVSSFCKSEFAGAMRRRARVITNPFDTKREPPDRDESRQRLLSEIGADPETRVVGFVGNLTMQKRPHTFVKMAAHLRESSRYDCVFPMFGEARPPIRQEVEALVEQLGLEGRCLPMGMRIPIEPWIAACDVVTAMGVREAFGRAVVEPMLIGTPVVAANDGGNPEIIAHGETGLLVEPDNAIGFASAVARLLQNPEEARAMAQRARTHALRRYSVERHVQDVLDIYRHMAGLSRPS